MTEKVSLDLSIKNPMIISFIAGTILGIIIGGAGTVAILGSGNNPAETASLDNPSPDLDTTGNTWKKGKGTNTVPVSDLIWKDDPVIGSKEAPVTMVWFSDLNCMYCRRFARENFPQVKKNFIEKGKVRLVKKDFITMGQNSYTLAKASQAVWKMVRNENPDVYWKWSVTISENQPQRKKNSKSVMKDIISTTKEVQGVNADQLRQKMNSIRREEIQDDIQQGRQRGITGTPGFLIFKTGVDSATRVVGAQPYSLFEQVINQKLGS